MYISALNASSMSISESIDLLVVVAMINNLRFLGGRFFNKTSKTCKTPLANLGPIGTQSIHPFKVVKPAIMHKYLIAAPNYQQQ